MSADLARRAPDALLLATVADVERVATIAVASGLTPLRRPEEAAVILLTGRELGLGPMASLRGIHVVSGRPVLSADLLVAVVRRSGACASWRTVESTASTCTVETLRVGEQRPASRTWTTDDARRAGLLSRGPWQQYPAQMLRHRVSADLAREVYPDVCLGLYTADELGGETPAEEVSSELVASEPPAATVPASRAFAAFLHAVSTLPTVRSIAERYRELVRDLWEEGFTEADVESYLSNDAEGEGARTICARIIAARGHSVTSADVTTVLTDPGGALVVALDSQAAAGCTTAAECAAWWVGARAALRGAPAARTIYLCLARRIADDASGAATARARKTLDAAVKALDPKPPSTTTEPAPDASGVAGTQAEWEAHLSTKATPGEVAGSWIKHRAEMVVVGPEAVARGLALTVDRLAALGVEEPHAWLDGVARRVVRRAA